MDIFTPKSPWRKSGSQGERIFSEYNEFLCAIRAEERDRTRLYDNFKLYWGVDYGQWDEDIVQQLLDENRHPVTINLLSQKINTLAGAITSNQFDVDFVPINGEKSTLTTAFKDIYLSDKSLMKWDKASLQCSKFGLIYQGVEQLVVDRREDPEGNLRFRVHQPGHVVFVPDWKSDDPEDCYKAWIFHYRNIEQIARAYGLSVKEIRDELEITRALGPDYVSSGIDLGKDVETSIAPYRIIETHEMVPVKTSRLVDFSQGMNGLPFPVMNLQKDREYLIEWGNLNNVNWERVREVPYEDQILKIFTFCPELSLSRAFEDRPAEVQIKRLDLFPWSADRLNGKNRGIIDVGKDIQQTINKHQSQKTHMINSAANGATIFNENLYGGDQAKMERLKKNKNNPAFVDDADLDGVTKTHVVLKDKPYDPALFQNEQILVDIMDLVTPVPAAMSSRTEGAKESGILYQSKVAIAEIGMKTLYESLRNHQTDKAAAYYLQAQNTYRDNYRRFHRVDGSGFVDVNKRVRMNGRPVVINDISQLPRCHVIIKEDQNGMINRQMNRIMYSEMLQRIPPEQALLRGWMTLKIARTMDTNEVEKKELELIAQMEMAKAMVAYKTDLTNMAAGQAQAEMVIAQIEAQMGQMMGPQQGMETPQQMTPEDAIPKQLPAPDEQTPMTAPESTDVNLMSRPLDTLAAVS